MGGDLIYAHPRGGTYKYQVAYLELQLVWGRGLIMECGGDLDLLFPVCVIGGAFPFKSAFFLLNDQQMEKFVAVWLLANLKYANSVMFFAFGNKRTITPRGGGVVFP